MTEEDESFSNRQIDKYSSPDKNVKSPPSSKKAIFEINDDIAKKLLESKFYLSALEFHTELLENGKELPRLKEFFSNPANFEIQMKLDPFHSFRKTASCLTLDSIDDLTRYSDDGQHETDERVTILEFELRKAKERIHELRENITKMTSDHEACKKNAVKGKEEVNGGFDIPINRYEIRTLNFLVNKYLLKGDYKLTSITFAEEVGDQDVDDWEDVGLNTGEPPDILHLLRDFSKHDSPNEKAKEIESLQEEIQLLTAKCEKMDKEMVQAEERNTSLDVDDTDGKVVYGKAIVTVLSEKSTSSPAADISKDKSLEDYNSLNSESLLNVDSIDNSQLISNNSSCDEISIDLDYNLQDSNCNKIIDNAQSTPSRDHNIETKGSGNKNIENKEDEPYDLPITNTLLPEQFLRTLYAQTCKKGISRLSTQMSTEDISPVEVITLALPNIIPNILLSKREEVIPLILCAVRYHEDSKTRDELLNMLFNLIKRPDSEQRRIIIDGCLSFANKVESSRIECELLPQCWEQINHKFAERRLLVTETCGSLSPCISPQLLSSLVFSMLGQMLEEENNEEVRTSVIKNLSVIITYMIESGKYMQAYAMLERSLNDIIPDVIIETKNYLLPVIGLWAMKINKLRSHLLPRLFTKCFESLQTWHEENMANANTGDANAVLLSFESKFKTHIDCLINLCTVMFCDCLLNAPFSNEIVDADNTDTLNIEDKNILIDNSRIPIMKNPLFNLDSLIGDREKLEHLVYKFDEYFKSGADNWNDIDWICTECIMKICEMSGLIFTNYNVIGVIITYMTTICKIFGKQYTLRKIVPFFEICMRNTGAAFLQDVPPVCSPLLAIFLCGVLANFDGEEQVKKLTTFIKQCLLTISTQNLSKEYLIYSITTLCRNEALQVALLLMLRETLVYPVSEVKMATAVILGVLVKSVSKEILSTQVAPAIITLTTDRDMNVITAAVPALGSVIESISDKNLLDKVILQIQTLLEDKEYKNHILLQKVIIKTFSKIVPNLETRLRDDFFIPHLKRIAESNHYVADVADRLEVTEELIAALSATLCCFLSKDIIGNYIIPTLKHLESELKDISPETMDIVVLLLKDAESKIDDDKNSTGSGSSFTSTSTTSSKLFGGLSSRFDKFKKKPKDPT